MVHMRERRVLLAEYAVIDGSVLLFGVRADWDEPKVAVIDADWRELELFAEANFGSGDVVRDLARGLHHRWHSYDCLIAPLAGWCDPDDVICLIPHGCLHYLPLHALKVDGRYLVERNAVTYSPSTAVLGHCLGRRASRGRSDDADRREAAVFGDSGGDLDGARAEATHLAAQLGV